MSWYIIFASIFVCLVAIALILCTYKGAYDSLSNADTGHVYHFTYEQPLTGTNERYYAKIIAKRILSTKDINNLNCNSKYRFFDNNFVRTPTLVTCKLIDGSVRSFYAERTKHCKRSIFAQLCCIFS